MRIEAIATGPGGRKGALRSLEERLPGTGHKWIACMHLEPDPCRESICTMFQGHREMT